MYCMSDTSPPMPRMACSPNLCRRLTSVKRAREPYDAGEKMLGELDGAFFFGSFLT